MNTVFKISLFYLYIFFLLLLVMIWCTCQVRPSIGKKPSKKNKNRRKMENKGNVEVSKTIVEDTQHDLKEGKTLDVGIEVGEH